MERFRMVNMVGRKKLAVVVIAVGLVLFLIGLFLQLPGEQLTTHKSLDGDTSSDGEKYSAIEEYVGGDAYNFIIGASLIGGRIAGTMCMKAVFIAVGLLIVCLGLLSFSKSKRPVPQNPDVPTPQMPVKIDAIEDEDIAETTYIPNDTEPIDNDK